MTPAAPVIGTVAVKTEQAAPPPSVNSSAAGPVADSAAVGGSETVAGGTAGTVASGAVGVAGAASGGGEGGEKLEASLLASLQQKIKARASAPEKLKTTGVAFQAVEEVRLVSQHGTLTLGFPSKEGDAPDRILTQAPPLPSQ